MENWKFALKSILAHKMRSLLTMLGIIIGVSAVVVIVALGTGVSTSLEKELAGDKNNVQVYFTAYSMAEETDGVVTFGTMEQISDEVEPELQHSTLQGLLDVEGVETTTPVSIPVQR